jgi:hypothetical protein
MSRLSETRYAVILGAHVSLLPGCSVVFGLDGLAGGTSVSEAGPDSTVVFGAQDSSFDARQAESGSGDSGPDPRSDTGPDADTSDSATEDDGLSDGSGADTAAETTTDSGPGGGADATGDAFADAPTVSFTNPLQIDVKALLTFNTVVTTATGGVGLTAVDGTGNDFPTHAEATALGGAGGVPNNAFFPAAAMTIPNVQLAWTNANNVGNSLVLQSLAGTSEAFEIPAGEYSQLQIYATGANGSSTLDVTLTYASGNPLTASSTATIPDWCTQGPLPVGVYTLTSTLRVKNMMLGPLLCNIYAIDLNPDPTRALTRVTFVPHGTSGQFVVFYGATAW